MLNLLLKGQLTKQFMEAIFFHNMQVNSYRQLFGYEHSSKTEKNLIQVWNQ